MIVNVSFGGSPGLGMRRKGLCALIGVFLLTPQIGAAGWGGIEIAGQQIAPGSSQKFSYITASSFESAYLSAPIFVSRGHQRGYALCVSAGIHGDELNGMEIARRVFSGVDPSQLSGTLIVLPSINVDGARSGTRNMIDKRDLNRSFPGNSKGSITAIVAKATMAVVREHCHALVDLHTGSNRRFNVPQIRVTPDDSRALNIARHFGVGIIALGQGPEGSLRRESTKAGLPSIIYEAGVSGTFQEAEIRQGVRGLMSILRYLEMLPTGEMTRLPESRIYDTTHWVRVPAGRGGYFFPTCSLSGLVSVGDELGYVVDPLSDERTIIKAQREGEIIGYASPQIVLSGYALVHIGISSQALDH